MFKMKNHKTYSPCHRCMHSESLWQFTIVFSKLLYSTSHRISGNLRNDLILAIFAITFTLQNIQYADILFGIVCYWRNFLNCKKCLTHIKMFHIFTIFANFVIHEKNGTLTPSVLFFLYSANFLSLFSNHLSLLETFHSSIHQILDQSKKSKLN